MLFARLALIVLSLAAAAAAQATQPAALDQRIDLTLDGLTLPQALVKVAEQTRLNLVPEWDNLAEMGVDRAAKLRGRVSGITARHAIQLAVSEAGARVQVELRPKDNIVLITVPPVLVTRAYPIGKILAAMPPATQPAEIDMWEAADPIIKALTAAVASDSWRENGGIEGALAVLGRQLIVTQTRENQKLVEQALRAMEKAHAQ